MPNEKDSIFQAVRIFEHSRELILPLFDRWRKALPFQNVNQVGNSVESVETICGQIRDRLVEISALDLQSPWVELSRDMLGIVMLLESVVGEAWRSSQDKAGLIKLWVRESPVDKARAPLREWYDKLQRCMKEKGVVFPPLPNSRKRLVSEPEDSTGNDSTDEGRGTHEREEDATEKNIPAATISSVPSGSNGGAGIATGGIGEMVAKSSTTADRGNPSTATTEPAAGQPTSAEDTTAPAEPEISEVLKEEVRILADQIWNDIRLSCSPGLKSALQQAVMDSREAPVELTPWQIVLSVVRLEEKTASPHPLRKELVQRFHNGKGDSSQLWQVSLQARTQGQNVTTLSPELKRVFRRARDIHDQCTNTVDVALRHLFAALIEYFADGQEKELQVLTLQDLQSCLELSLPGTKAEENSGAWEAVIGGFGKPVPAGAKGTGSTFGRGSRNDDLCLGIEKYISAIQSVFQSAEPNQDFVFGLFAPWGRGKSTLMEKAAEAMQDSHVSVFFGASKYPTRPEVWVHLYQTILRAATGSFFSRLRLGFRLGLLKVGWWPLVLAAFTASFSLLTQLGWALNLLSYIIGGMGLGLLVIVGYGYRILAKGRLLQEKYALIPDHADKLGLQAVIGDDLERLLRAWFPTRASPHTRPVSGSNKDATRGEKTNQKNDHDDQIGIWKLLVSYFADPDIAIDFRMGRWGWWFMLLCLVITGIGCWQAGQAVWAAVPLQPSPAGMDTTAWQWAGVILLGLFYALLVTIAFLIGRTDSDRKRVLLVVDDLDRCEPEQSLSVIESIRWFLDNPKVNSRLHVAMLMERDALETACRLRAREHGKEYSDDAWRTRFEALREKLFMVELSLPTLRNDEVSELAHLLLYGKPPPKPEPPVSAPLLGAAQPSSEDQPTPSSSADGVTSPDIPGAELPPKSTAEEPVTRSGTPDLTSATPIPAAQDSGIRSYRAWPFPGGPPAAPVAAQQQTLAQPPSSSLSPPRSTPPKSSLSEHFSDDERTKLEEVFHSIPPEHLTPRSVRAALFRYLFARQLLSGVDFSPQDLMEHLAHAMFAGAPKPNFKVRHGMEIARVISQLT